MQERAEVMQLGGQLLFKGVGDLGSYLSQKADTEEGKAFWADGGNGRALLHGMAGAALAALAGRMRLRCPRPPASPNVSCMVVTSTWCSISAQTEADLFRPSLK